MKLAWPGFNGKRTLIIPLEWREFSVPRSPVRIDSEIFEPKGELHITLIGKHLGTALLEKIVCDPDIEIRLKNEFQGIDWVATQTGPVHRLARTRQRTNENRESVTVLEETIILRLSMPGMAAFYNYLESTGLTDPGTPVPPPHVTFYTRNCPAGIGLVSDARLEELTSRVFTVDEFRVLCQHPMN